MDTLRSVKDEIREIVQTKIKDLNKTILVIEQKDLNYNEFIKYARGSTPILYKSVANQWPLTKGGIELFSKLYSNIPIKVRMGAYSRANGKINTIDDTVGKYIEKIYFDNSNTLDYAGYQISPVKEDLINYPNWLPVTNIIDPIHFWLGPSGTYTALHSDTCDKLVYQCSGNKIWYLISPEYYDTLYIDPDFGRGYDTSPVDPRKSNNLKYPLFDKNVIQSVEVCAGDILYLPGCWYHAIESLSISLSFEYKSDPVPFLIEDNKLKKMFIEKIKKIKDDK